MKKLKKLAMMALMAQSQKKILLPLPLPLPVPVPVVHRKQKIYIQPYPESYGSNNNNGYENAYGSSMIHSIKADDFKTNGHSRRYNNYRENNNLMNFSGDGY
ncbi:hypothetical protein QR98_0095690 [Sarcoptes scabiei]|nr:hypothetical protein QR98_0095690 [Sarcoptes scabiei]